MKSLEEKEEGRMLEEIGKKLVVSAEKIKELEKIDTSKPKVLSPMSEKKRKLKETFRSYIEE